MGEGGDFFVLDRQDAWQHFDDRYLRTHVQVEAGEFDTDGTGADDQQRFRKRRRDHGFLVGPDQLAVRLDPGKLPRAGAGGKDDMRGAQRGEVLAVLRYCYGLLASQLAGTVVYGDLVFLQQMRNAGRKLLRHAA